MNFEISVATAITGGLLSFLSPCVLPLVPGYLAYISGSSNKEMQNQKFQTLLSALFFVFGFSTIFIILGASASAVYGLIGKHTGTLSTIAGLVIIIFGIHYLGLFKILFLYRQFKINVQKSTSNYFGAYVIGLCFGFGWTPCIGPILGTILILAANQNTAFQGVFLLAAYSVGLGIPFLVFATLTQSITNKITRIGRHFRKVELISGTLLIITGLLMVTNSLQSLGFQLLYLFPNLGLLG